MKYELNEAIPLLQNLLSDKRLILFAGAGISIDSNIPDWNGVIKSFSDMAESLPLEDESRFSELQEIIKDIRCALATPNKDFDVIQAATVLKNIILECKINDNILARSIYSSWVNLNFYNKIPNPYHNVIVTTDYPFILTTNYDILFEKAARDKGIKSLVKNSYTFDKQMDLILAINNSNNSIIHVHGAVSDNSIDNLIFTKEDYNRMVLKRYEGFSFALRMLFTRYSTLFVGYGASDPHLEQIFEELINIFPVDEKTAALFPRTYLVMERKKVDAICVNWKKRVRADIIVIDNYNQCFQLLETLQKENPRRS